MDWRRSDPLKQGKLRYAKELGYRMQQWHSSAGDPIYAVGSFISGGHMETPERVQAAIDEFEKILHWAKGGDRQDVEKIIRDLKKGLKESADEPEGEELSEKVRRRQRRGEPKRILRRIMGQVAQKRLREKACAMEGNSLGACSRFETFLRAQLATGKKVGRNAMVKELSSHWYTSLPKETMDAVHDYAIALAKAGNKEIEQGSMDWGESVSHLRRTIVTEAGMRRTVTEARRPLSYYPGIKPRKPQPAVGKLATYAIKGKAGIEVSQRGYIVTVKTDKGVKDIVYIHTRDFDNEDAAYAEAKRIALSIDKGHWSGGRDDHPSRRIREIRVKGKVMTVEHDK